MQRNLITQLFQFATSYADRFPKAEAESLVLLAASHLNFNGAEVNEALTLLPSHKGRSAKQRITEASAEYWQYLHDNTVSHTNVPYCRSLCAVEEAWR